MKIQTYSICVGNQSCNAFCPFCVAKMTPKMGAEKKREINWQRFKIGCQYAKDSGVSTVLFTGKGEPTLFPEEITSFLRYLNDYRFPFIELQTNGLKLFNNKIQEYLFKWKKMGLSTIVLSVADYRLLNNKVIYGEHYDIANMVEYLHSFGFSIRLSCVLMKDYIDSLHEVCNMIEYCKQIGVEQLTFRQLGVPDEGGDASVRKFVLTHRLAVAWVAGLKKHFNEEGTRLMELMHGATVYDYKGQNVCLADCFTIDPTQEKLRQLIFSNDNHLRYDWQYEGAILL